MKRSILIFVGFILLLVLLPATVLAWDDCPHDKTCTYPGTCSRYVDTNQDGICDHGQEAPVVDSTIETPNSTIIDSDSAQSNPLTDLTEPSEDQSSSATEPDQSILSGNANAPGGYTEIYHLSQILIGLTLLYLVTYLLSIKGIIRVVTHRRLWNMALLLSFLVSAVLGIILIVQINFGIDFGLPFDTLFWHVETGIAMGGIGIFHVIWHWTYFKKMFVTLKQAL